MTQDFNVCRVSWTLLRALFVRSHDYVNSHQFKAVMMTLMLVILIKGSKFGADVIRDSDV